MDNTKLKEIRSYYNLSPQEFANKLKVSKSLIYDIESGKKEISKKLIGHFVEWGISADWVFSGKGEMFLPTEEEQKARERPSLDALLATKEELELRLREATEGKADLELVEGKADRAEVDHRLHVLRMQLVHAHQRLDKLQGIEQEEQPEHSKLAYTKAAAGQPISMPDDETAPRVLVYGKYDPKEYFVAAIEGTSMAAAGIMHGDTALLLWRDYPEHGEIMYCWHEGKATLKKLRKREDTWQLCWCDGSGHTEPITDPNWRVFGLYCGKAMLVK